MALAREWLSAGMPANANALSDGAAAAPSTTGTVALGHTECDVVRGIGAPDSVNISNNAARRPGGGRQFLAGTARRNLYLYVRAADVDRAWVRSGGGAEDRQAEDEKEAGRDLIASISQA